MTFNVQVQLARLPLTIFCRSDAKITLQPSNNFKYFTDGVAQFDMVGFTINSTQYSYGEFIPYKEVESVLQWLKSFQMEMPSFQQSPFGGFDGGFGFN
jgi:hypothetical protein